MNDLREKAIRGGAAKVVSQGANFALRLGSLMILGRLLEPKDFGLVGMVTAVIGILNLFKDFGLSTVTVQRANVTEEQTSTLFWINMLVGTVLGLIAIACAPLVASFYHEPRLVWVTMVLATGFVFNAAGVQHWALLQRGMRFTTSAAIDIISLVISTGIAIGMARAGFGYWALVVMAALAPLISTVCVWFTVRWKPGRPHRNIGLRSMMRFGGTLTLNGFIVYIAYNLEKVLLGKFWGADAIGLYGRAYQLINIPTDNLNSSIGGVVFSALSRLQDQPERLKSYFLKSYAMVLGLTLPITLACGIFGNDLILVVLGPKWTEAAPVFRLLAPTVAIFALINPFSWLLFALGMVQRSLKIALVIAPLVIIGYLIGLPYGPKGVAFAYSAAMMLWVIPDIYWCVHGTLISFGEVMKAISRPAISGAVAGVAGLATQFALGHSLTPLLRVLLGGGVLFGLYGFILLYVMGEGVIYLNLLRAFRKREPVEEKDAVLA
jgi:O-antigen/teichoic acid export membrane protein